ALGAASISLHRYRDHQDPPSFPTRRSSDLANNYAAHKSVAHIQQLLFQGRNDEAEQLVNANFVCVGEGSGYGRGADVPYGCFQTLGEMQIHYGDQQGEVVNYRRQLDLATAMAGTSYKRGGVRYLREYFTSFEGDVGVIRLSADTPKALTFSVTLARNKNADLRVVGNELQLFGALN